MAAISIPSVLLKETNGTNYIIGMGVNVGVSVDTSNMLPGETFESCRWSVIDENMQIYSLGVGLLTII